MVSGLGRGLARLGSVVKTVLALEFRVHRCPKDMSVIGRVINDPTKVTFTPFYNRPTKSPDPASRIRFYITT